MTVTLIMIFIDTLLPFVSNQIFISKPHFLGASGDGLNVTMTPADPTLHDSVVDIEPVWCSVEVIRCVVIFPQMSAVASACWLSRVLYRTQVVCFK